MNPHYGVSLRSIKRRNAVFYPRRVLIARLVVLGKKSCKLYGDAKFTL